MKIDQIMIVLTSVTAVLLTQQTWYPDATKWSCIVGMISQPFWLWSSYRSKQWGIFITSIIYTLVWMLGIYNNFL